MSFFEVLGSLGLAAIGFFCLYLRIKLGRSHPHRKSDEIQTLFSRTNLD